MRRRRNGEKRGERGWEKDDRRERGSDLLGLVASIEGLKLLEHVVAIFHDFGQPLTRNRMPLAEVEEEGRPTVDKVQVYVEILAKCCAQYLRQTLQTHPALRIPPAGAVGIVGALVIPHLFVRVFIKG